MAIPIISDEFNSPIGQLTKYRNLIGGYGAEPFFIDDFTLNWLTSKYTFAQAATSASFSTANSNLKPVVDDLIFALFYKGHKYEDQNVQSKFRLDSAEVQLVKLTGVPTGGTFTLTYKGQTTAAINWNDNAATVQTRLENLSNINPGDVVVSGASPTWTLTFSGTFVATVVPKLTATPSLTGGTSPNIRIEIGFDMAVGAKYIDSSNYLYFHINGGSLNIYKWDGGVATILPAAVTLTTPLAIGTDYWIRGQIDGNLLTVTFYTADPDSGAVAVHTNTFTLSGANATKFGSGTKGLSGIGYWKPNTLFSSVDDVKIKPLSPSWAGNGTITTILGNEHINVRSFINDTGVRSTTQAELSIYHQFESAYQQTLSALGVPDAGTFDILWTDLNDVTRGKSFVWNATATQIQTGLRALFSNNDITVTGSFFIYTITFGTSNHYVPLLQVVSAVTGGGNPVDLAVIPKNADSRFLQTASSTDPTFTQADLQFIKTTKGENWTLIDPDGLYTQTDMEVGPINTYNYWNGIRISFSNPFATLTAQSIIPNNPIDLLLLDTSAANLMLHADIPGFDTLPIYPVLSTIQMTSHPLGLFDQGYDSPEVPIGGNTTGSGGYIYFEKPLSSFTGGQFSLRGVTGVRIKLVSDGSPGPAGQFVILSMRAVKISDPTIWTKSRLDINTIRGGMTVPVNTGGNPDTSGYTRFPPLIRGNTTSLTGQEDPKPSDGALSIRFRTGAFAVAHDPNRIQLYFRENPNDYIAPTVQSFMVGELEFGKDFISLSRYAVRRHFDGVDWLDDPVGGLVDTIQTATTAPGVGLKPTPGTLAPLKANTNYLFQAEVQNNGFRLVVYELDDGGVINFAHFETGFDFEPEWIRQGGRVGWWADLNDYDVVIDYFRSSSTAFSILRTVVFRSHTPVVGAQLVVNSSGAQQLFNEFVSRNNVDLLDIDVTRVQDKKSYRFTGKGQNAVNGIKSNPATFDDWENMFLEFDIWLPSDMAKDPFRRPKLYLIDPQDGGNIGGPSVIGEINYIATPNGFTHNKINLGSLTFRPVGSYEVHLVSTNPHSNTWWVSDMKIGRRTVIWEARAIANGDWTPFAEMINDPRLAIHFGRDGRGKELQLQARALSPDAWISEYRVMPKYAQPGRIILI